MAVETLISVEQFFDLPVNEGVQRELIHGRLIEMPAPAFPHAAIQLEIGWLLRNIVAERFPHLIVATHSGFIVGTGSAQAPEVFLIDRDRVQAMPSHRGALRERRIWLSRSSRPTSPPPMSTKKWSSTLRREPAPSGWCGRTRSMC